MTIYKPFSRNPFNAPSDDRMRVYNSIQDNTTIYVLNGQAAPFPLKTGNITKESSLHCFSRSGVEDFRNTKNDGNLITDWKLMRTW